MKKFIKIFFSALALIVLIALFFLSSIAKNYFQNNSLELIGRNVSIKDVSLNYLTSELKIIDFKVFEKDDTTKFISFDTLKIDTELYQLINNKFILEEFYLSGLNINIIREDSITFNFDDIITHFKSDTTKAKTPRTEPFHFVFSNINLTRVDFVLDDQFVNKKTEIEDLSINLPFISWNQKEKSNADFRFNLDQGGYIESNVNINPINGEFDAKIAIEKLYLHNFYEYINKSININAINGDFSSTILINGNTKHINQTAISGEILINNLDITSANKKPLTQIKKITSKINSFNFNNSTLDIEYLKIEEPKLYVEVSKNSVNWAEIFPKKKKSIKKDTPKNTSTFNYNLNHFELKNGNIEYSDNLLEEQFNYKLNKISIVSDSISSSNNWIKTKSNISLNNKGNINSNFNINLSSLDFYSKVFLSDLDLSDFGIQTKTYLNINSLKGNLNSNIIFTGNFKTNDYLFNGETKLSMFEIVKDNRKTISINNIAVNASEINIAKNRYLFKSIDIDQPYLYFNLDSTKNNLSNLVKEIKPQEKTNNDSIAIKKPKLYYNINQLHVNNGKIDYRDNLTGNIFDYQISDINLYSKFLNSRSRWISTEVDAKLNKRGTLKLTGGYNPISTDDAKLKFSIENLSLADFNDYSNYYIGHKFNPGILHYYSDSDISDGRLTSKNTLMVRNSNLESNGEGLYDIPLKVAFYLSENKENTVVLDVPLTGDLNNPNVSITNLITKTFSNLIFKIVATPTKMVTGMFEGEKSDFDQIYFDYLETNLNKDQKNILTQLVKAEDKNPELIVELTYKRDRQTESEIIAKKIIAQKYKSETKNTISNDSLDFKKYVFKKVKTDSLKLDEACINLVGYKEIKQISNRNTSLLIKNTMDFLQTKNKATEIYIIESTDTITQKAPRFETNFYTKLK